MVHDPSQPSLFKIGGWHKILIPPVLEAVAQDKGRLILFVGHRDLFALGHYLMAWRLLHEESIILVDGANIFDLHLIMRLARRLKKDVKKLLEKIHISRAFTMHQLEAVITDRLEEALKRHRGRICIVSGLLDTLSDEEVPIQEAISILRRIIGRLRLLADQGYRVVVLAPDPPLPAAERKGLASLVMEGTDHIFSLSEEEGMLMLKEMTKRAMGREWVLPDLQPSMGRHTRR